MKQKSAPVHQDAFTIENNRGSRACVLAIGAALQRLEIMGNNRCATDVVLGFDTAEHYLNDDCFLGVVVGRCAGRISDGQLVLAGKQYPLTLSDGCHHLHGGVSGFGKRQWQLVSHDEHRVQLAYHSEAGEQGYPGAITLKVTYTLGDDDVLSVHYEATADAATVISPAQHSYFNLAGHASGTVLDHELMIDSDYFVPVTQDLLAGASPVSVEGTAFDVRHPRRIGDRVAVEDAQLVAAGGFDHSWLLDSGRDWQRDPVAIVAHPETGRRVSVYTDRPALHFYSGNMLPSGLSGKDGSEYVTRGGFCLETQHLPQPVFDAADPSVRVSPEQPFHSETRFAFEGFQA